MLQIGQNTSLTMSARGHIGREVIDAKREGIIKEILYADDFEYRLNMDRFRKNRWKIRNPTLR